MTATVIPWALLAPLLGLLLKYHLDIRKLKLAERTGGTGQQEAEGRMRAESIRLVMEIADRLAKELEQLRPLQSYALHFREAIGHIKALIVAETSEDWITAERNALRFLRGIDEGHGFEGVALPSEMELPK